NSEFGAATLKIENGVGGLALGEECLAGVQLDNSSTHPSLCQEIEGIKDNRLRLNHWNGPVSESSLWPSAAHPVCFEALPACLDYTPAFYWPSHCRTRRVVSYFCGQYKDTTTRRSYLHFHRRWVEQHPSLQRHG